MKNTLTHLDLFSGIGGFALAAQRAGFRTVAFCEKDKFCQSILIEKFGAVLADPMCKRVEPETHQGKKRLQGWKGIQPKSSPGRHTPRLHADVHALEGRAYENVTLLTGGFPCQPYSTAGQRGGSADDRALWPQMLRVIREARPAWVVGENVAGLASMVEFRGAPPLEADGSARGQVGDVYRRRGHGALDEILASLEAEGYEVQPLVVPACAAGALHRRARIWIVAHRHSPGYRQQRRNKPALSPHQAVERGYQWQVEPNVGRVAHGIPSRTHRLKALGNAIVPQVAEAILREIARIEGMNQPPKRQNAPRRRVNLPKSAEPASFGNCSGLQHVPIGRQTLQNRGGAA